MKYPNQSKLILSSWLAIGLCGIVNAQSVEARIDLTKTSAPISKLVYGQFLEHIGNIINTGIWAELLDDRKFFNNIPAPPPPTGRGPRFGRTQLRQWTVVGPSSVVSMDTSKPFVGKHSPQIELDPNESHGIQQAGIGLVAGKSYVGRIYLAASQDANVTVSLVWGDSPSEQSSVVIAHVPSTFKRFALKFSAPKSVDNARLAITGTGSGNLKVGAISLMPSDNIDGFRPEVIGVLKQLHSGAYRVPGGNYISAFEWRDAIGDPDHRAPKQDPVWNAVQPNDVGTDEFMKFCKLIDVEPYISVSTGLGDAWSAKEYVEYCNGSASTPMGHWRALNGHKEPYHVKYWGIGNESWGYSYQFGAIKLAPYIVKHNAFAEAMRSVDPSIILIASGAMADTMTGSKESLNLGDSLIPKPLGPADWTGGLFAHSLENMDWISEHFYNYGATHFDLAKAQQVPNDPNEPLVTWMRRPANHIRLKYEEYKQYEEVIPALKKKPVPISLDEWAYSGGPPNSYKVVPAYAWSFHEMFRHSDLYQMACLTFATALFNSTRAEAVLNPTGLMFKMYREHFGTIPVEVTGNSPQPKPTDPPGGEQPSVNAGSDTFPLDVAAAWSEDHKTLSIAVLNLTETTQHLDLKLDSSGLTGKGTLWRMAPDSLTAVTQVGKTDVKVDSSPVEGVPASLDLPKFSISIYELKAK